MCMSFYTADELQAEESDHLRGAIFSPSAVLTFRVMQRPYLVNNISATALDRDTARRGGCSGSITLMPPVPC